MKLIQFTNGRKALTMHVLRGVMVWIFICFNYATVALMRSVSLFARFFFFKHEGRDCPCANQNARSMEISGQSKVQGCLRTILVQTERTGQGNIEFQSKNTIMTHSFLLMKPNLIMKSFHQWEYSFNVFVILSVRWKVNFRRDRDHVTGVAYNTRAPRRQNNSLFNSPTL